MAEIFHKNAIKSRRGTMCWEHSTINLPLFMFVIKLGLFTTFYI
jgi:hypothetical protein